MSKEYQPFKDLYTIQDLENLSGILAHTLRIWEKRYDLLHPVRAGNNVRYYAQDDLLKLLNVAALYRLNYKISKIAALSAEELVETVRTESKKTFTLDLAGHALKTAMFRFDQPLFDQAFKRLLADKSFSDVFNTILLPLLYEIGMLWQTDTITIAHEHFLTNLIRQKILLQVEHLHSARVARDTKVFVLFLPVNEVHELGLLYSHYELLAHGYRSIYLGQSVPLETLKDLQSVYPQITFVTSFTIQPSDEKLNEYIEMIAHSLLRKRKDECWISGRKIHAMTTKPKLTGIKYLLSSEDFLKRIDPSIA